MRRVLPSSSVLVVVLCVCSTGAAQDAATDPVVATVPMVGGDSLSRFHEALRQLEVGRRSRVRVMHYGDSNVAAGLWTRTVRELLQARFGDGGPGYVVPQPWGSRQWRTLRFGGAERWRPRRLGAGARFGPPDGLWGIAGVAVEGRGRGRPLRVLLARDVERTVTVHALGWRRGGTLHIRVDDGPVVELGTRRRTTAPLRHRVLLGPGAHVVTLSPAGYRPVRLLGVDVERSRTGLVYDTLGINGHRQNAILRWDRELWAAQLRGRPADLMVLSYGGNEALDPDLSMERYESHLSASITRARSVLPDASCLVVAPVAMCTEPQNNAEVVAIQRRVAPARGCAFWDTSAVSGGPSAACPWVRHGLLSPDRLHLTPEGYELVGRRFTDALLAGLGPGP